MFFFVAGVGKEKFAAFMLTNVVVFWCIYFIHHESFAISHESFVGLTAIGSNL